MGADQLIFVDGQLVMLVSGTQDAEEAKRVFAGFEKSATWHLASTKSFSMNAARRPWTTS
jgi:hypothetical protein